MSVEALAARQTSSEAQDDRKGAMSATVKCRSLVGICVVLFIVLACSPRASAQDSVSFYQEYFDVSKAEARSRIDLQKFTFALSKRLPSTLGDALTSWYFDNQSGKFVVLAQGQEAQRAARTIAQDLGISNELRVETTDLGQKELEQRVTKLEKLLSDFISVHKVRVGLASGQPLVEIAPTLAADETVQRRLDKSGIQFRLQVRPSDELDIQPQSCVFPNCNELAGGTRYFAGNLSLHYARCTAGFLARDAVGRRVGLTAGHCVKDIPLPVYLVLPCVPVTDHCTPASGFGFPSDVRYATSGSKVITDYAMFYAMSGAVTLPNQSQIVDWRTSTLKPIVGYLEARPPTGITLCKHGSVARSNCGVVTSVSPTGLFIVTGTCSQGGDSGSPVDLEIWGFRVAVGLAIGAGNDCPGTLAVQPIHEPVEEFGLSLP